MGHQEFGARAEAVLGTRWKSRFSRGARVNYATVKRWANGDSPVPGPVIALLEALERLQKLGEGPGEAFA